MKQTLKKTTLAYGVLLALGMSSGPALAEWQWSAVQDLGDAGGRMPIPKIAVEPNSGKATTAWGYGIFSDATQTVMATRYEDGIWQPASTIGSGEGLAFAPQVALDKKGNATVAWISENLSGDLNRLSSATWNKPQSIWRETQYELGTSWTETMHLVKAKNGVATAVWVAKLADDSRALRTSRLKNNQWTPAKTITQVSAEISDPSLSIGSNGVITAVWSEQNPLGYRIISAQFKNGGWKPVRTVSTVGSYNDGLPAVTTDGKNRVTVVWQRSRGDGQPVEILASQLKQGEWSAETLVGSAGYTWGFPQIASDKKGQVTAVWRFGNPEGSEVFGHIKASQLTGKSDWTEPTVVGPVYSIAATPQLAMDAQDNATVAWEDYEEPTSRILASHQTSGTWGQPIELCTQCYYPSIGADNQGNVIAVWDSRAAGSNKIQTRRGSDQP